MNYLLYIDGKAYGIAYKDNFPKIGETLKTENGEVVVVSRKGGKVYSKITGGKK